MNVRAKFFVNEVTEFRSQGSDWRGVRVKASAAMGKGNEAWSEASPSGSLELQITNMAAAEQFKPGSYVYLNFTEAPDVEPAPTPSAPLPTPPGPDTTPPERPSVK